MSSIPDPLYLLRGSSQPITALCPRKQSKLIVGNQAGSILIWDLKTRRVVKSYIEAHSESILCIYGEGEDIFTQGRDGHLKKWKLIGDVMKPTGFIRYDAVGFFPMLVTERHYCLPSSDSPGQLALLERDGRCLGNLVVKENLERRYGMAMVARQQGSRIFVGYEDGSVVMWDSSKFELLHREKLHDDPVMAMDVSRTLARGISASANCKLQVWTWDERNTIQLHRTIEITNPGVNCIQIRDDDKIFACACWDHSVRIFGMKKLNLLALLKVHKGVVRCLSFDFDDFLYVGSDDGSISVWGIYQNK